MHTYTLHLAKVMLSDSYSLQVTWQLQFTGGSVGHAVAACNICITLEPLQKAIRRPNYVDLYSIEYLYV